jgi:hypothetical protein
MNTSCSICGEGQRRRCREAAIVGEAALAREGRVAGEEGMPGRPLYGGGGPWLGFFRGGARA